MTQQILLSKDYHAEKTFDLWTKTSLEVFEIISWRGKTTFKVKETKKPLIALYGRKYQEEINKQAR